jgi:hypothetical protein
MRRELVARTLSDLPIRINDAARASCCLLCFVVLMAGCIAKIVLSFNENRFCIDILTQLKLALARFDKCQAQQSTKVITSPCHGSPESFAAIR